MKNKGFLVVVLVCLILLAFGLGYLFMGGGGGEFEKGLVRRVNIPLFGEVVFPLGRNLSTDETAFDDSAKPIANFQKPVTEFLPESQQRIDATAVSRGYGEDRIERALLRGVVSTMDKRFLEMDVTGKNFKVYFPRVFEQVCIPSTITDTKEVKIETKKGFIDLTTYREGVEERGMEEVGEILSAGDDALVLARYKAGDFVAITVAGYGCVR